MFLHVKQPKGDWNGERIGRGSRISLKRVAVLHAKRLAIEGSYTLSLLNEISNHCVHPFIIVSDTVTLYNDRMGLSIVK